MTDTTATPVAPEAPVIDATTPIITPDQADPAKVEADAKAKELADAKNKEKRFTQAELDAIVQDRLAREKEASAKAAEKSAKKAADEAAAKNGEWQTLAETRAVELETAAIEIARTAQVEERAETYKNVLSAHVAKLTEKLPENIKALLADKDPVAQLEYLTKYGATLGIKDGVPPTPSPDSTTSEAKSAAEEKYKRDALRNRAR